LLEDEHWKIEAHRRHVAELPRWIAEGYVSEDEGHRLQRRELRELAHTVSVLEHATGNRGPAVLDAVAHVASAPDISRGEVLALLAQTVVAIAQQQTEIAELRRQVAAMKNAALAVFGEQKVIDQLSNASGTFEQVDVTMKLEEEAAFSAVSSANSRRSAVEATSRTCDGTAAVEGLAAMVAGLNFGGAVDLKAMNATATVARERAAERAQVRSKGEVRIRIGKISRGSSS
jgi:hypothetical protein